MDRMFLHSTQQLQKSGARVLVCKIKITRICMYSITEKKKETERERERERNHSLKCIKISIMKQNMWFVLAEWLSSINANNEIQKNIHVGQQNINVN